MSQSTSQLAFFDPRIKRYLLERIGRGEWIRTTDLLVPNQAL